MARQEHQQRKRESDYYHRQLRRNQIIFSVLAVVLILSLVLSLVVSL